MTHKITPHEWERDPEGPRKWRCKNCGGDTDHEIPYPYNHAFITIGKGYQHVRGYQDCSMAQVARIMSE